MRRPIPATPGPYRDNCDAKCPAAALVYVQHEGLELALCGHCFERNMMALFTAGWGVREDLRTQLREEEGKRR